MKKLSGILVAVIGVLAFTWPAPVYAAGLGVSPPSLMISETLRGNEYNRQVMVFSSAEEPINVSLGAHGDIAGWATFCDTTEQNNPIKELSIPANGMAPAIVKIKIPADAVNGDYESVLDIDTAPLNLASGSDISISLHSEILLKVSVTGNQVLAGTVTQMNAGNTEIGLPVILEIDFTNTGNVVARPTIKVNISQEGNSVSELSYSETEVKVDSSEKIKVSWDTNGIKSGEYLAKVIVMLGENSIAEREVPFRILPRGGLSSEGQLTGIKSEGKPALGAVTKILATFSNTGAVETLAKGYAEMYLDGTLVTVLDSQELAVDGGKEGELVFYFTPDKQGIYEIKVHATMGGRETNTVQMSLTVGDAAGQANPVSGDTNPVSGNKVVNSESFNLLYPIGGAVAILFFAAVVLFAVKRNRRII